MREIIFDTETTGLSPTQGHRLVEIGCIELVNRVETGAHFHYYFNPERDMPSEAEAIHGLSGDFLADKPLFADKVTEFMDFIGDSPLVAHNAGFDLAFLNAELKLARRAPIFAERIVDTLAMARQRFPGAKHTLDALCTRFAIDRSMRVQHGALLDAQLLAQVYVALTGGRQIGLDLMATQAPPQEDEKTARPYRKARLHAPSPEEEEAHAAFLERLKDPVWLA